MGNYGSYTNPLGSGAVDAWGNGVTSSQSRYVSAIQWINGQANYIWSTNPNYKPPAAAPVAQDPTPAAAPVAPHLQFNVNTIGSPIFLAIGRCRLPGLYIWAQGVDASSNILEASTLTCALAYCEPIDSTEAVHVHTMTANGTLFYDVDQGGVVDVPNISQEDLDKLATCIDGMSVYLGAEDQAPDPTIVADRGAALTPAFRGLRYIVLRDFPLSIANNAVPNISVEWRRDDDARLNVGDVFTKLAARRGVELVATGIDDECDGFVVTAQETLIQNLSRHRDAFNFQVVDGNPIKIVRRPVNESLTIDLTVAQQDCKTDGQAPAVSFSRIDPASLPKGIDIQYTDPAQSYDTKMQPARHNGTGVASSVLSLPTDVVTSAHEARSIAYETLYRIRSRALTVSFEIDDLRPEIADVLAVSTDQGNFTVLVDDQTVTKKRTNQIVASALLTSAGVDIAGDSGDAGSGLPYPEILLGSDSLVSDGAIWSGSTYGFSKASTNVPKLIPLGNTKAAPVGGNLSPQMLADANFVYIVGNSPSASAPDNEVAVYRASKTDLSDLTTLRLGLTGGANGSVPRDTAIADGFIYAIFNNHGDGSNCLVRVDLANFTSSGITRRILGAGLYWETGMAVAGGVLIVVNSSAPYTTIKHYSLDLATELYDSGPVADWPQLGRGIGVGNFAYFGPWAYVGGPSYFLGAKIDPSIPGGSGYIETFDIRDDPAVTDANIGANIGDFQDFSNRPWSDGEYLYFLANNARPIAYGASVIARRRLDDLSVPSPGSFPFALVCDPSRLILNAGSTDGKYHYITGSKPGATTGESEGVLVKVAQDFSTAQFYPRPTAPPPPNDNFARAAYINPGETKTVSIIRATKESGEPDHGANAGGHSVWYLFSPPATQNYTLDATTSTFDAIVAVYTGDALDALTPVASSDDAPLIFSATLGERYYIAVDGKDGETGTLHLKLGVTPVFTAAGSATVDMRSPGVVHSGEFAMEGVGMAFTGAALPPGADGLADFVNGRFQWTTTPLSAVDVIDHPEMIMPGVGLVVPMSTSFCPQYINDFATALLSLDYTLVMEWYRLNAVTQPLLVSNASVSNQWFEMIDGTIQVYVGDYDQPGGTGERFTNCNIYHNPNPGAVNVVAITRTDAKIVTSYNGNPIVATTTAKAGLQASVNEASVGGPSSGLYDGALVLGRIVIYPPQADADLPGLSVRSGNMRPPVNDSFAAALEIDAGDTLHGHNWLATKETSEPSHAGNTGGHSVWWKFIAPASTDYTVDLAGSETLFENWLLGVYAGTSVDDLTEVDSAAGSPPSVTFAATAGATYYIAVDGHTTSWGGAVAGKITIAVS